MAPARGGEGDAPRLGVEQIADRLALARAAEGQRAVHGVGGVPAGRDEQQVVGDLIAGAGDRHAGVGSHGGQRVVDDA